MELRVLRYFLAVAQEESITGAAEALHLSQPTLSRQLKELEDDLGKQLLVRGTRKVTLTEDGILLRKRAEEILDLVDQTESDIRYAEDELSGTVRIGTAESYTFHTIARCAATLRKTHPAIHFDLYNGDTQTITERLHHGSLDFGIVFEPVAPKEYEILPFPETENWGVIMRKDCPLAEKESLTPDDLKDYPLLLARTELSKRGAARWLGLSEEKANIVGTYTILYNATLMVQEGLGLAVGFSGFVNSVTSKQLTFRPLSHSHPVRPYFIWKKDQIFSKAAEAFLAEVRTALGHEIEL